MNILPNVNASQTPAVTSNKLPANGNPTPTVTPSASAPTQTVTAAQKPAKPVTADALGHAVQKINNAIKGMSQNIEFSVDKNSDRTIVKVVDSQTGDVIRQIPSQETLQIAQSLDHVQGLLIQQKA